MEKNSYSNEFKKQIVMLYQNGKSIVEIIKEYGISKSAVYQLIENFNNFGSFKVQDNHTVEENELIYLRKENQQLRMENDILKQAALNNWQKIGIINNNKEKYSMLKMCQILKIAKSTYYYQTNNCVKYDVNNYEEEVISAFNKSRKFMMPVKLKLF